MINLILNNISKLNYEELIIFETLIDELIFTDEEILSVEIKFDKIKILCKDKGIIADNAIISQVLKKFTNLFFDNGNGLIIIVNKQHKLVIQNYGFIKIAIHNCISKITLDSQKIDSEILTKKFLIQRLKQFYDNAPEGFQMTMVHLFGIIYADQFEMYSKDEIAYKAIGKTSIYVELSKGVKLAKYVKLKSDNFETLLISKRLK